jgi:SNF2 family DNA or RNA helicase
VKWLAKQKPAFLRKFDGGEVVVDESPAYKHHASQRSKAAAKVLKRFDRRACLTATPTSNGITDLWHQVHLLDGGRRLGPSYFGFRNTVCQPKQVGQNDKAIRWTDKEGAEEAVYGLITDIVIRHRRQDCIDIPATQTHTTGYDMTPKQQAMYDKMEQDQLIPILGSLPDQVTAALTGRKAKIMAVNAAAVVTKLLQIASGAVYDGTGGYSVIDTSRYELIMDLAEARKHPLVFFFWKHQRDLMIAEATKRSMSFAVIDADTTDAERFAIVSQYQLGQYDVLFAHPQSAAHGLTLTKGNSTIWPGPTYNLEWFVQGSQRQARIGQKSKTEVLTVIANGSREAEIYDHILMPKNTRMSNLLNLVALRTASWRWHELGIRCQRSAGSNQSRPHPQAVVDPRGVLQAGVRGRGYRLGSPGRPRLRDALRRRLHAEQVEHVGVHPRPSLRGADDRREGRQRQTDRGARQ